MENEIEIWKDIPGYEGLYQISTFANVMSLERQVKNGDLSNRNVGGKLLTINKRSYNMVRLSKNQRVYTEKLSILMAITFLNHDKNSGLKVDHKDNDEYNDFLYNLQITTHRNNIAKDSGDKTKLGVFYDKNKKLYKSVIIIKRDRILAVSEKEEALALELYKVAIENLHLYNGNATIFRKHIKSIYYKSLIQTL